MKIAGVDFPEPMLKALRDGRLVVFAGAGVSMGPPAGLPDFKELTRQVAEGTGQSIGNAETEDRFLGQLEDHGTDVHQRAAQILQRNNPEPTALHLDLLRVFGKSEDVRTVTTNFDLLFEQAADNLFNPAPKAFEAPELPLGQRFQGIVHVHGSVKEPEEMVLTARDFGRAYLTEADGWARRFLVDLFANHTVLFVGYSHSDTIMTYLTPSLPPDDRQTRFALVGDQSDDIDHWRRMGIEPVVFHQADTSDYSGLDQAVGRLADHVRRGVLDWQREITAIAGGPPPIDEESAGTIEHALSDPVFTRFFVEAAESPDWIGWLEEHKYLDALFTNRELSKQERTLSHWLASRFALTHDEALFDTIRRHGARLNPIFWNQLCGQLREDSKALNDAEVANLTRWLLFLTSTIPTDANEFLLLSIADMAEPCARIGAMDGLLRVYEAMTARLNQVPPQIGRHNSEMYTYEMQQMLTECIKPNLPEIAEPVLEITARRLSERHSALAAWGMRDSDSYRRSAIEPHQQDNLPYDIDTLIDTARECLEWLAVNRVDTARLWSERYTDSKTPLLRRLAIHTVLSRDDLSADDKIAWLLDRFDIHNTSTHHEVFKLAQGSYPHASSPKKTALIEAVSEYQAREVPERENWDANRLSAYRHFTWFHWLQVVDPDFSIVKEALSAVWAQNPKFVPLEYPDFTHWMQTSTGTSPWTAEALLTCPAAEVLSDLLAYQPTEHQRFDGHDRWAMLRTVDEAARTNPSWGLDLADSMVEMEAWDSDLWYHVISTWATAEFNQGGVRRVLSHLSAGELHQKYSREIANVLGELVRKTSGADATGLPHEANQIANALRIYAAAEELPNITSSVGGVPQYVRWLDNAINHTSGKLALFWIFSIELWRKQQETVPQSLNAEYRNTLDAIVVERGVAGKLGRTVLASQFHFLLAIDEKWALDNLLPLFDTEHEDFQCAWDGFLAWGHLSPPIAEHLREQLINAVQRVANEFDEPTLTRFVECYIAALGGLIVDANDEWITGFFKIADAKAKRLFTWKIGHRLRYLDETAQQEWWSVWLKEYWKNRLQGVPSPLDDEEIAEMLEWVIHLRGVFPEAVNVATRMRRIPLRQPLMLHRIGESSLIERYPNELAKLLVHLGQWDTQPGFWHRTRDAIDRLLAKGLPSDLDQGLRELIVRHDLR